MQRRTLRRTLRRTQRTTHREEEAKVKGEEEDKRETSLNPMRERTEKNRSRFHFDFVLGFLSSILSIYPSFIILSFCCRTPSSPFLTWWFFSFHWSSFCSHNKTFSFSFPRPLFSFKVTVIQRTFVAQSTYKGDGIGFEGPTEFETEFVVEEGFTTPPETAEDAPDAEEGWGRGWLDEGNMRWAWRAHCSAAWALTPAISLQSGPGRDGKGWPKADAKARSCCWGPGKGQQGVIMSVVQREIEKVLSSISMTSSWWRKRETRNQTRVKTFARKSMTLGTKKSWGWNTRQDKTCFSSHHSCKRPSSSS